MLRRKIPHWMLCSRKSDFVSIVGPDSMRMVVEKALIEKRSRPVVGARLRSTCRMFRSMVSRRHWLECGECLGSCDDAMAPCDLCDLPLCGVQCARKLECCDSGHDSEERVTMCTACRSSSNMECQGCKRTLCDVCETSGAFCLDCPGPI